MEVGRLEPTCLFCGRAGLVEQPLPEGVEPPSAWMPFEVDHEGAQTVFEEFASSSIWYPGDLGRSTLELRALFLPAWIWEGTVETHWAAVVRGRTQSGKRPESGSTSRRLSGVLVPASPTLTAAELTAIAPFADHGEQPFDPHAMPGPFELGELTRSVARRAGFARMGAAEHTRLESEVGAVRFRTSRLIRQAAGRPVLLPVWIGAYRRGDRLYRVVINGQTGRFVGTAPISVAKVIFAVAMGFAILVMIVAVIGAM
jgi:hypothetical protein